MSEKAENELSYVPFGERSSPRPWRVALPLVTLTPLYGGGVRTRHPDEVDIVRVPSVRGQLRFWWRALFAGRYGSTQELFAAERGLFGGTGDDARSVSRSEVAVSVEVTSVSELDTSDVGLGQDDAYAIWPARKTREQPVAPRRRAGVEFTLTVSTSAREEEVEAALRAFLCFGGIGGRTRRGLGALGIRDAASRKRWLAPSADADVLTAHIKAVSGRLGYIPALSEARFHAGGPARDARRAWLQAVAWLRDFRQGTASFVDKDDRGDAARLRPSLARGNEGRPGRSRWPEPDKLRHLSRKYDHEPFQDATGEAVFSETAAWPRAQLGLPIEIRFQSMSRNRSRFPPGPYPTSLHWSERPGGKAIDRLASPLIIKPMALSDGRFVPLALWLNRALPEHARVGIMRKEGDVPHLLAVSEAPFSGVGAGDDNDVLFNALRGYADLREAFMAWAAQRARTRTGGTL